MAKMNWARASALAGAAASACYTVGDLLLLGTRARPEDRRLLREEPDLDTSAAVLLGSSTTSLRAGALWGVLATPLHVASAWQLYDAVRPAGNARAVRIAGTYAGAASIASFIHGTFYPWGATFHAADDADPGSAQRARLLDQAEEISQAIRTAYLAFGVAVAAVSVETAVLTYQGRTRYPRWSAALVTPLVPVAAVVAGSNLLPTKHKERWEGAGISLGMLAANAVAGVARRS
ncbi:DUF6796 family protein [Rhodococcus artemisiae]|uniref:Uncharacterized protein n=1 Tax=Rhodococcus artemisiae TaxID=714159 RepID=A0ABU7L9M7_9NOCA|nr:DUF6796 family protein [Rhodococcus artemisiae]MEE2058250.1 hypothetical protein [Rhodococcus artemisiae]